MLFYPTDSRDSLPDAKPPLNPPPPYTILANVIPRILDIVLALLLGHPLPFQPVLLPLLNVLCLLEPLLRVDVARVGHVHLVDVNESLGALDGVAQKVAAVGKEVGVDGFGHEVHVPCCYGEGDEDALHRDNQHSSMSPQCEFV